MQCFCYGMRVFLLFQPCLMCLREYLSPLTDSPRAPLLHVLSRLSAHNKLGFDMQLLSKEAQNVPESEKIRIVVSKCCL